MNRTLMTFLCGVVLLGFTMLGIRASKGQEIETGQGLICDTQVQVERFVREFTTVEATIAAINKDEENACGVVHTMYVKASPVSRVRNSLGSFDVVPILVVGINLGLGWIRGTPVPQFTIFKVVEEGA